MKNTNNFYIVKDSTGYWFFCQDFLTYGVRKTIIDWKGTIGIPVEDYKRELNENLEN